MRVVIADKAEVSLIEGLKRLGCEVEYEPSLEGKRLTETVKRTEAAVLVVRSTKVPAPVLNGSSRTLKLVIRAGAGYDNIDTKSAAEKGIAVCNTPGMNAVAVAELTIGHLIALDRRLFEQDAELKAGHWNKGKYSRAMGLKGRSLLVIGAGAIGCEVISRAKAFGMHVDAVVSGSLSEKTAASLGVGSVDSAREALLKALPRYDAVTIHVPAVESTKGMCDSAFFGAMREGALFVNTSRGSVVDDAALIEAVRSGRIRAGLDVYNNQPAIGDVDWKPAIADLPGVCLTHHCGASTDQAQNAVGDEVVRMVGLFMASGRVEHCVNGVA